MTINVRDCSQKNWRFQTSMDAKDDKKRHESAFAEIKAERAVSNVRHSYFDTTKINDGSSFLFK